MLLIELALPTHSINCLHLTHLLPQSHWLTQRVTACHVCHCPPLVTHWYLVAVVDTHTASRFHSLTIHSLSYCRPPFAPPPPPAPQVDTAGDSLSCVSVSPSGEVLVFGGSGGYTHLWASSTTPRVVGHNRPLVHLKHPPQVRIGLHCSVAQVLIVCFVAQELGVLLLDSHVFLCMYCRGVCMLYCYAFDEACTGCRGMLLLS